MKCFGTTCWIYLNCKYITLNGGIFWKKTICRKVWWEFSWQQLCWHQFPLIKVHLMWSRQHCWNIQWFRWTVKFIPLCNTWVSTCPLALHTKVFFADGHTLQLNSWKDQLLQYAFLVETGMRDLQVYSTRNWSRWLLWRGSRLGCLLFGKSQSAKRHLPFAKDVTVFFTVFALNVVCLSLYLLLEVDGVIDGVMVPIPSTLW